MSAVTSYRPPRRSRSTTTTPAAYQRTATEDQMQASITELVDRLGGKWAHIRDSRGQPAEGFPDLVIALPPVICFVELKSQQREITAEQEEWLGLLRSCVVPTVALVRPEPKGAREMALDELLRCLANVRLLSAEEAVERFFAADPI